MEAKVEKLKNSKVKITVSVSPKEMIKHFDHAYSHLAPSVKLDGFRPGKAPRPLIESAVGISRILSDAINMALDESYIKALEEHKLNPVSAPSIKINKYPNYGATEEEIQSNFEYEVEIAVFPEVEIGDYTKAKIKLPEKEAAKKEDIDKIVENLRKQKASFTPIEGEAKKGDFAEISFEGSVNKIVKDAMCSKHHPLVLGDNTMIPGFEDEIIGMKKGESKTFKIKFPKEYHAKDLAGKDAEFKVELLDLKEVKMADIDDKFAAEFGHKNVEDLLKAIEENLKIELDQKHQNDIEAKVLEKVLPLVKADIPEEMLEKEVDRMVNGYREQITRMGLDFERYLESTKKTLEDMKKDMRDTALKNIKTGLLLGKIVEEQKLDTKDPEAGKKAIDHLIATLTK